MTTLKPSVTAVLVARWAMLKVELLRRAPSLFRMTILMVSVAPLKFVQ